MRLCVFAIEEREAREEETMCQRHHPLPGSVTSASEEKAEETAGGGRYMWRWCEIEEAHELARVYVLL